MHHFFMFTPIMCTKIVHIIGNMFCWIDFMEVQFNLPIFIFIWHVELEVVLSDHLQWICKKGISQNSPTYITLEKPNNLQFCMETKW